MPSRRGSPSCWCPDAGLRCYVGARYGFWRGRLLPGRIRHVNGRERRPLDIMSIAAFGAKVAVDEAGPAARQRDNGRADTVKTLEHVVVDPADLALGADGLAALRIPHHDISIGADADPALARIDIEDAGNVGGRHRDKLLLCQPPGMDTGGPQERHAILESAGAVGDFAEIADAQALLFSRERTVIGGDDLQRARLQPGPQTFLMALVAERRRHHAPRGVVPVLVLVLVGVEQQMLDQRLAEHALSGGARPRNR